RDYVYRFLAAKAATENIANYATKINFYGIITTASGYYHTARGAITYTVFSPLKRQPKTRRIIP
ncbi:MAG: hypothetical protein RR764_05620, partial [Oscillospiraceae bacterium]